MIQVDVPASSANLGPGFDALALALSLHDRMRFSPAENGLSLEISGEGAADLPKGEDNLVLSAAKHFFDRVGYERGLRVQLHRRIPLSCGLGSSAAAIVGGLLGASEVSGTEEDREMLFHIAAALEGHPDNVAAALYGGLAVAYRDDTGYGCASFEPSAELKAIVFVPGQKMTTAEARGVLPEKVGRGDAVFNLGRVGLLVGSLVTGRPELMIEAMKDVLHQPHRVKLFPGFKLLCSSLNDIGVGVALSGAGPSLIGFVEKKQEKQALEQISGLVASLDLDYRVLPLEVDMEGARVARLPEQNQVP